MKKITLCTAALFCFLIHSTNVNAQWTDGQNASYVVGQVNFNATVTGVTDSTFTPNGVVQGGGAIDARHHVMYVIDFFAHRVLRFAYPLTANSPVANLVIGQPTFTASVSNNGGLSAQSLMYPGSCTVDTNSGTLWVADNGNQRILRYDSAYRFVSNMPAATEVLGQSLFTTATTGCTSSTIDINNSPITGNLVYYDALNDALWIVDNANYRVLRFDNPKSLGNGAAANAVLGQTNFTSNSPGSGQNGFARPDGITVIGASLYVSDAPNSRVLRFDSVMTLANGANASGVLGQVNFTNSSSALTQSGLDLPSGLASDGSGALYVADLNNNRIMIFENSNSLANGANANFVLLQTNFTSNSLPAASQSTGGTCSTLAIDNTYGALLALDRHDNRYLLFNSTSPILGYANMAVSSSSAISVYPNPSNGVFTIQEAVNGIQNSEVEVYNLLGEQIYSARLNASNTQIDLSNNAAGIYLYRVLTETGNLVSEGKFVIEK